MGGRSKHFFKKKLPSESAAQPRSRIARTAASKKGQEDSTRLSSVCVCVCVCVCVERETLKAFQNEVASVLRFGVGGGQRGTCLVEKLLPMM